MSKKRKLPEMEISLADGLEEILNPTQESPQDVESVGTRQDEASPEVSHTSRPRSGRSQSRQKHYGTKTSLYLEDELFLRAKHFCTDSRITLTELVNKSLSFFLRKQEKKSAKEEKKNALLTERKIPSKEE